MNGEAEPVMKEREGCFVSREGRHLYFSRALKNDLILKLSEEGAGQIVQAVRSISLSFYCVSYISLQGLSYGV